MKKLIELRQQKNALKNQMRSLLEKADSENRSLNAEEGKQFDELRAKADALDTEISRLESVADEERSKPGTGIQKLSSDELRNYIVTGDVRSLSTSTDSGRDGGYTVIPELDREVMRQLQDDSVMRVIATVKTAKSNEFQKLVSTGGATVGRGTEGSARSETNTPKIERVTIKLNPIYAYPKTTQEILDFSEVDILGWLSSEIADTFASTEEDDFVNGDGNGKPKGFMAYTRAATSDKTRAFGTIEKIVAASGTAITADELIDILYKLKAKYRKNAVWVMNSGTAGTLQKLKNENGDYIWRDSLKEGAPDMLLGRPVYCLESMPDTYSNFSEASRAFLTMTMRPWLANFEQQIKAALLVASPVPGTRYLVEFDSADLLRATPTERYATYEKGIKNGIMNPNEAREREGMPPREGGDEFSQAWKQTVEIKGRKDE